MAFLRYECLLGGGVKNDQKWAYVIRERSLKKYKPFYLIILSLKMMVKKLNNFK